MTFKENCPDLRNSKVVDLIERLKAYNTFVDVYDPWIDVAEAQSEYGWTCLNQSPPLGHYSAIVLAVGHKEFKELGEQGIRAFGQPNAILFDVKSVLPMGASDGRL